MFGVVQAMLLRAYAMLGAPMGSHCLDALAARAQEQLPHFDATSMATMLWAFARLKYKPDAALLRSCEAHATCNVASFAPQDLVRAAAPLAAGGRGQCLRMAEVQEYLQFALLTANCKWRGITHVTAWCVLHIVLVVLTIGP